MRAFIIAMFFAVVAFGQDPRNAAHYQVRDFQAKQYDLVGQLVALSFDLRNERIQPTSDEKYYTVRVYQKPHIASAVVRVPKERLPWLSSIPLFTVSNNRDDTPRLTTVYGRVTRGPHGDIFLDVLGQSIVTDAHGTRIVW
jgi:hypothetical protein